MSSKRKMRRRHQKPDQAYEIVYEPLKPPAHESMPEEVRDALPDLYALTNEDPEAAVPQLRAWIERQPLPIFFNWLSGAYSAIGDREGLDATVRENYRLNPRYLFARINYAELCLRNGDLDGVREALGESMDLKFLVGGRKRIHVSEVAAYFYVVGRYYFATGDVEAAERTYELMQEAAPDERATEGLRRLLRPARRDTLFHRG